MINRQQNTIFIHICQQKSTSAHSRAFLAFLWWSTRKWDHPPNRIKCYRIHRLQQKPLAIMLAVLHCLFCYNTCEKRFYTGLADDELHLEPDIHKNVKLTGKAMWVVIGWLIRQLFSPIALGYSYLKDEIDLVDRIAKLLKRNKED